MKDWTPHDTEEYLSCPVLPAEAIYMFAAWLTCRREVVPVGSSQNASRLCDLVQEFIKEQEWEGPRNGIFPHNMQAAPLRSTKR